MDCGSTPRASASATRVYDRAPAEPAIRIGRRTDAATYPVAIVEARLHPAGGPRSTRVD
jgi:hypothetical protein